MKNNNLGSLNALLEKKTVTKSGKTYVNLIVSVVLNNGKIATFEVSQRFFNRKFNCLLINNINEVK